MRDPKSGRTGLIEKEKKTRDELRGERVKKVRTISRRGRENLTRKPEVMESDEKRMTQTGNTSGAYQEDERWRANLHC